MPRAETLVMTTPAGDLLDAGLNPFSAGPGPIVFEPIGVTITPGCNEAGYRDFNDDNVIDAGETPCLAQGAAAGSHTWNATLGISNGPCSTATTVTVDLFNVAMPDNELDPRASTNIAYPRPQTAGDRFGGWQVGSAPVIGTAPLDANVDGRAEAGSLAIQNYPSYLLDVADPDGAGPTNPVLPLAVYGGLSRVAGYWIPFYFAQFEAGDLATAFVGMEPHPYARAVAALGHLLQPVTGDPTAGVASATSITDVCAPATTTTLLHSTAGGRVRAANPSAAGTHMTLVWRATRRDLENDGYENSIDNCPANANVEDPRSSAGPDGDMLDSACDPSPGATNGDEDADGVLNALDNCPLVANASQAESELEYPPDYFNNAFDGGPLADHLGDACDSGSVTFTQNNKSVTLTRSSTVANGHWHLRADVDPTCYSMAPVDADLDGYCAAGTTGCTGACVVDPADSGPCASTSPPSCAVRHSPWATTPSFAHLLLFDTDRGGGDNTQALDPGGIGEGITCPGGAADTCPEQGFDSDWVETYLGTNPAQACSADFTLNNEPNKSWAVDYNDDTRSNLSDVTAQGPSWNKFVNAPGGNARFDINVDGLVGLSDLVLYGFWGWHGNCRRTDGTFPGLQ